MQREDSDAANRQDFERALGLADEIADADENQPAGWYEYPWEHLGDALKDVQVLIRGLRAARELIEADDAETQRRSR